MQIDKTSIIKTTNSLEAISVLIKESFGTAYIKSFLENLVVDGDVGTIVEVEEGERLTTTTVRYFIVTTINSTLRRVEYCTNTTHKYTDPDVERLMNK